MKFAFIARHRHVWPVSWLCGTLDVSRSGFHAWLRRAPSAREIADEELTAKNSLELHGERSHLWRAPRLAGRSR